MKSPRIITALLALLCVAGCDAPTTPAPPTEKPAGFNALSDKTGELIFKVSAGVATTGAKLAANDIPGAKRANDLTASLLPGAKPADLDWFAKLCAPETTLAALTKAKADNAALLEAVRDLRAKVAAGVSPEEAASMARSAASQAKNDETRVWRDRALYAAAVLIAVVGAVLVGVGVYFSPGMRRMILVGVCLEPFAGFLGWLPQLLESPAFNRLEVALAWILGFGFAAVVGFGVYEVIRWLRSSKAAQVAQTLAVAAKAVVSGPSAFSSST